MRYLLFGVWLALLLAAGLAFVHERYSLASLPYTGQTKIHGFEQHIGPYSFDVWGFDADIFEKRNADLIGPVKSSPTQVECKETVTIHGTTLLTEIGDESGIQCFIAQNVQVNNGVMIQVNQ